MDEETKEIILEMPVEIVEPEAVEDVSAEIEEVAEQALAIAAEEPIVVPTAVAVNVADFELSEAELAAVKAFEEQIDLTNSAIVLQYGSAAQKKIATFSEAALENVRTKDLGEVGDMISDLVVELKGFNTDDEEKGFFKFLKKGGNSIEKLKARYAETETNVDKIVEVLEGHQNTLTKDIVMLDKMYDTNLVYYRELSMYILAGKEALKKARETTLAELQQKAVASGKTEDAQAANDFAAQCDRFEKKIHDLELTRTVSIQMAPEIRMIQNSNTLMVEKIQSTIANTIPLWKNQMVLALGLQHSKEAMEATREVTDLTNDLLKKNADTLKQGTIDIAKESERGVIDIETLEYTNAQLISTFDEVIRIQDEGRAKRREAEAKLQNIENELRAKLLEIHE